MKMKLKDKPLMISCEEFENFVIDYFEGKLPFITRLKFTMHLWLCSACRKYIREYKKIIEIEKKYFSDSDKNISIEPPDELLDIVKKLKD